jgi:hypothetical protein
VKRAPGERGPAPRRGQQFSETPLPELLPALARATATIRLLDLVRTSTAPGDEELERMRSLSEPELARLRRETLGLQTDLRAELRRREET